MNNFTNILTTIRRPFQQELRKGCRDDVVVNGLGSYVQLWVKNGHAFTLESAEKAVLDNLASLFENYASISSAERQRTLEEATKRIDTALGGRQRNNLADVSSASVEQQPSPKRTSPKKQTQQTEMLPLFGETESEPESTPIKREPVATPITHTRQTENLSLFGGCRGYLTARRKYSHGRSRNICTDLKIFQSPTDLASLDFLSEPLQYLKGIGAAACQHASGRTRYRNSW